MLINGFLFLRVDDHSKRSDSLFRIGNSDVSQILMSKYGVHGAMLYVLNLGLFQELLLLNILEIWATMSV